MPVSFGYLDQSLAIRSKSCPIGAKGAVIPAVTVSICSSLALNAH